MVKGCEVPRVWTEPLRRLTRRTTLGYDVVDFAQQVLGLTLHPWERWLFIHALEIVGSFDGDWHFRFRMVVVLVGRQNGKTLCGAILSLYFLYVLAVGLIIGTAQDLEQAEDTWRQVVEIAESDPDLAEAIEHVWHTNGAKRLQLTGNRDYRVRASTRKAGRGKSADLVLLDELREHQTWAAYSALSKTGMAKERALLWCMSNAGDGTSVVLRHFRLQGHRMCGDPDGIVAALEDSEIPAPEDVEASALGFFEWSAEPDADKHDKRAWAQANPSLGYTITERALAAACADDPDDVFKTECLCQWVTAKVESPFPDGAWEAGTDEDSSIALDSPLWWGVDIAADRQRSSVAVCGLRPDNRWHIEVVAYRKGIGWVSDWFQKRAGREHVTVALQGRGAPVSSIKEVLAAIDDVEVVECVGTDVAGWAGKMWDGVSACLGGQDTKPIMHRPQPSLDLAAAIAATRPLGDGAWAWDRNKSLEDISPLVACCMAFGLAQRVERVPVLSAYEDNDLLML